MTSIIVFGAGFALGYYWHSDKSHYFRESVKSFFGNLANRIK